MGKGGTEINYPQQSSYGESMRESLQAQIDLAPELYGAEASRQYGRPAYAQLETDILRDTLLGGERFVPGGTEGQATTMEDFDEAEYLRQYPDVLEKIKSGEGAKQGFTSAKQHYERYGKQEIAEGRRQEPRTLFNEEAYLEAYPDVMEKIKSGVGAQQGFTSGKEHYEKFGKAEIAAGGRGDRAAQFMTGGSIMSPIEGAMQEQGGLLDLLGGTQKGRFGTGEVGQEFVTRPATEADVTSGTAKYVGQEISEGRIRDGQMIGETRDVIGTEERRAGFDPQGEFMGLAAYGSDIAEQAARRTRAADIGDVSRFAGVTREAMEAADPLSAGLLGADEWGLGAQAQEGLEAGRGLSPRQRREAEQAARAGWEARGLIRDPEAVVSEVESVMEAGGLEEAKRRAFAQNVMGVSQAMTADPFMAILGRPSGASQQIAQQGLGSAQYGLTSGPQQYSPEAGLSYMLGQQTNQANLAAAQQAAAATRSAGLMGGLGAAASAIKWCWIAREVYGESNPKWMIFREWLLNKAPEWFRLWYLINGEQVAAWLKDKPEMKARIRLFMDSKVGA